MTIKRIAAFLVVPALVVGMLLALGGGASAIHDLEQFELDRNAQDDGAVTGDDWDTLYSGGGNADEFTGVLPDIGADGGTQFQAGGSKDDLDISSWLWKPGEPLDKDDITNAYASAYIYDGAEVCPPDTPSGDPSCTQAGDLIIYFGLDRFANNGAAQVGFWFFQNPIGLTNISRGGGFEFSGVHAVGDVLVQSNFSQGGVIDTITVYEWVGAGGSDGTLDLVYQASDCVGAETGALACATVNQGDTAAPWPFTPKFGSPGTFPQGSFFEGGINISRLVPEAGCFSGFLGETRTSTPFDARLKDFVLGEFSLCSLEGNKYLDVNGNGMWDDGEDGLSNWEINLTGTTNTGDPVALTAYTDADGHYIFDGLASGTYAVNEVCPDGSWVQTDPGFTDFVGCGSETYSGIIVDLDNAQVADIDFGNGQPDIDIAKTCTADVFVGDDIDYEIVVTNNGNVDLYGVSVLDSIFGELGPVDLAADGGSATFNPSQVATSAGTVFNEVTAEGDYALASVSASADCTTTVYELTVTKDADEFYSRYFEWDITKSVSPATWNLFSGESGTSEYSVALDQTGFYENDWRVTGSITIDNPAPMDASLASVVDDAGGIMATVECPAMIVPAMDSLVCSYDTGAQDAVDANPFGNLNTATATLNNNNGGTTDFDGTAPIDFSEATVELVDEEATVSDTYLGSPVSGTYSGDMTWTYSRTFTCDADEGQHDNVASFETNDTPLSGSDDASVMVNCYDLTVTKSADESYSRYFQWDITKSVIPASWALFSGESGTSEYTVNLIQTGYYENDWRVMGSIEIANSHPTRDAELTQILDDAGSIMATVDCPSMIVPAASSLNCTYDTGAQDAVDVNPFGDLNTATATQQLYTFDKDEIATADGSKDYEGTAPIDFNEATVELVDEEATVSDTYIGSPVAGTFSGDMEWTYSRTFTCDADEGQHDNTASFITNDTPLSDSADAAVTVDCYDLTVTKTADEYYTRYYEWQIDKVVDNPGPITLLRGESVDVNYTVMVNVASMTDNDWRVDGTISIANSHPSRAADLTQILDDAGGIPVAVDCGGASSVPAGGVLNCSYDTGAQDAANANPFGDLNTATATQQLYTFDKDLMATADGTKDYAGTAPIDFSGAMVEYIDEQIDVNDSYAGFLGTVNALTDVLPAFFYYPRTITAGGDFCGTFQVDNLADFVTNDTGATGSDPASVIIEVPCEGCTPGFWQGGAGSQLWDVPMDQDWNDAGYASAFNPYDHAELFNDFFNASTDPRLDGITMYGLVSSGGTSDSARRAARDMVAAYLNESAFPNTFPATDLASLVTMWYDAVAGGDAGLDAFHVEVSGWNNPPEGGYCPLP